MANALSINGSTAIVQPTPLISISISPNKNKLGYFGSSYQITLSGSIVWTGNAATSTTVTGVSNPSTAGGDGLSHILNLQNSITATLTGKKNASEGLTIEVMDADGNQDILIFKHCKLESIDFEEGIYVNLCRWTAVITSDSLYDSSGDLHTSSQLNLHPFTGETYPAETGQTRYFLEDFQESWDISADDSFGRTSGDNVYPRFHTVSRTVTAVSKVPSNIGVPFDPPWVRARDFLYNYISEAGAGGDAETNLAKVVGSALLGYNATSVYNNSRNVQIDKANGSVTIVDSWVIADTSDTALENFECSVSSDSQSPYVKVSLNGTIRGLDVWHDEDEYQSSNNSTSTTLSRIRNAQDKWNALSNSSGFGVSSILYKRANNACNLQLNDQPLSVSVSSNEIAGELSYSLEFDNRPRNIFLSAVSESISITDTHPGDNFSVIPVIGRSDGPILQYAFGRTEYKRSLSIEAQFDYSAVDYTGTSLLNSKPSVVTASSTQLKSLINSVSPANDSGIRKYFLSPPQETWTRDGRYTLNLEWTYELDT